MVRTMSRLALAAGLIAALAACSHQPVLSGTAANAFDRQTLLSGELLDLPLPQAAEAELLAVNDDMRAFLAAHVPPDASSKQRVEAILAAILDDGLRLDYNLFQTLTAEEAFYSRQGNCMSFTSLFVALARESGLRVRFQEVEVPPSWESQGDTWMYNKHINAVVDLHGSSIMIDFAREPFDTDFRRRLLADDEALARYHNNVGVHLMTAGQTARAFTHFSTALQLSPRTGYFWTNLGSLYRRADLELAAESAYLTAIEVSRDAAGMSNLARLYRHQGRDAAATYYEEKVELFRRKNPYYLHNLATEAYAAGDYELAVQRARSAIRRDRSQHEFHRLLGLAYVRLGEVERASGAFESARERAVDELQRGTYNRKLSLLANL